jgi:KDO2-lipid IV(A) lauroyltransferase
VASRARRAKHLLEYLGFRALAGVVRAAGRGPAAGVAGVLGGFAFDVVGIRREVAMANVRDRLAPPGGEPEVRAIARRSYEVAARTFVDLLRADRLSDAELWRLVRREEIERLRAVLGEGRGAVLVSGHFGNWELAVLALRRLGIPVGAMAADLANPWVDARVKEVRRRAGVTPISARHGLREAVRCLRADGFVATLMDQDARRKGVFIDFLGTPASSHTGVVSLAMRTGSPLVPGVVVDEGSGYRLVLGETWRPRPDLDEAANLRDGAERFHRFLEARVREHPDNYFWAHRRWKTRPIPGDGA